MGTSSQKFISGFLSLAMCGVLSLAPPVMAQQSDACGVIRGHTSGDLAQIERAQKNFPEPLRKKITKAFAKKLKQTGYHTDGESAEIAFRLSNNVSQELELNIESYPLNPTVKQALIQAIQENVEVDGSGIQRDVCYQTFIDYSKPHPWETVIMIISLPIIIPVLALTGFSMRD